jgi:hypothetical protein
MTAAEAKRIIHPDTTLEALAEFESENAKVAAVDEACLVACAALDKQIPKKPVSQMKSGKYGIVIGLCPTCVGGNNSEYPYCGECGQTLEWEK